MNGIFSFSISAQHVDPEKYNNFVRCHIALQYLCLHPVKTCVDNIVTEWHRKQVASGNLKQCTNQNCPQKVSQISKKRKQQSTSPWFPSSCQICDTSGSTIKKLYAESVKPAQPRIVWENINPTRFATDPVEVAKVFGLEFDLLLNDPPKRFEDFDAAALLKIMMRFPDCYKNDANKASIKKVSSVNTV